MPAMTLKGNNTGATADPVDLSVTDTKAMLDIDDLETAVSNIDEQINSVPVTDTAYGLTEAFENAEAGVMQNLLIKGRTSTQLIANGNFSNGTTGYTSNDNISIVNGNMLMTGNGISSSPSVYQDNVTNVAENEKYYYKFRLRVTNSVCSAIVVYIGIVGIGNHDLARRNSPTEDLWYETTGILTIPTGFNGSVRLTFRNYYASNATANEKTLEIDGSYGVSLINLTADYGAGNEPDLATCQTLYPSYFDGTKSTDKGEVTVGTGTAITRARYPKLQSVPTITDTFDVLNGVHTQNVEDVAITSGTAVNTTNYPLAKDAVGFVIALTAGGTQTGTVGTDSASGNGVLYYQLAEPVLSYYPPKSIPLKSARQSFISP